MIYNLIYLLKIPKLFLLKLTLIYKYNIVWVNSSIAEFFMEVNNMADSEFKNSSIYKEMMEIFMKLDNEYQNRVLTIMEEDLNREKLSLETSKNKPS